MPSIETEQDSGLGPDEDLRAARVWNPVQCGAEAQKSPPRSDRCA